MNYTTGLVTTANPVPDVAVHPNATGMPPIGEALRKTNDVLTDCDAIANRIVGLLCNDPEEKCRADTPLDSLQRAAITNCDLAICVMHKLELALSVLGG